MTRQIIIKGQALADLDWIYRFGVGTWGQQRAGTYIQGLDSLFTLLAEQPEIGRERKEIDPPVRTHPYKSHLVIFRASDAGLDILRVVHARSDWATLLGDLPTRRTISPIHSGAKGEVQPLGVG